MTEQQPGTIVVSRRSRRAAEPTEVTEQTELAEPTEAIEQTETAEQAELGTDHSEPETEESGREGAKQRGGFRHWRRQRPFISGLLVVLGGIELFFSSQLDTGNLHIQFGIEGLQATIIPIALVLLGVSVILRPTHHIFYGIIALVLAVYSLIGVNLGGFILGMLLSSIGSVLVVAWMGPRDPAPDAEAQSAEASDNERRGGTESAGEERDS